MPADRQADRCSTRRRPTPSCRPWKSSRRTTRGTCVVERLAAAPELEEHRRLDRAGQAVPLQPGHGLRPGAARPEEGRRQARRLPGRVGQGAVPGPGQHADRGLAGRATSATRQEGSRSTTCSATSSRRTATGTPSSSIRPTACSTSSTSSSKTDGGWQAAQSSVFDLKSNKLRPDGWTSSDAAGLPIFPAVVRYDELKRGAVEHALRVTVRQDPAGLRLPGHALRQPADRREPAADGRAAPAAEGLRRERVLAGGAGDPEGAEEVRHVRGRQRHRLGDLGAPRTRASRCCTRSCAR